MLSRLKRIFERTRVEVSLPDVEWTADDALAWREFMKSTLGKKVEAVLMSAVVASRQEVIPSSNANEIVYQAGRADGLALAVKRLREMAAPEEEDDTPDLGLDYLPHESWRD